MFRGSNAFPGVLLSRGSNIQVFLGSEVVTSKGYFLPLGVLTSVRSDIQGFLHSEVLT